MENKCSNHPVFKGISFKNIKWECPCWKYNNGFLPKYNNKFIYKLDNEILCLNCYYVKKLPKVCPMEID